MTVRIRKDAYYQAEKLKKQLERKEQFKFLGTIALGAVIGYAIAKALEDEGKK